MDNQYECACEHGENCTRTTMCKVQSAVEVTEYRIKELEADNKQLVAALEAGGSTIVEVHKIGKINQLEARVAALEKALTDLAGRLGEDIDLGEISADVNQAVNRD